jgi:hypothetical protein
MLIMKLTGVSVNDPNRPIALEHLATVCGSGSCPTLYKTSRGTYVVQGFMVGSDVGVNPPAGETLVEIPAELLMEAVRTLQ